MVSTETRICQNCKNHFTIEPEDCQFYEKMKVPLPAYCFPCRLQQRLAFWPFGKFHKRTCDFGGEKIISIFPPHTRFPVYCTKHWYSDEWEPAYLDYDPRRPFLDQLLELQNKIPRPHQYGVNNTACDYSDDVWDCKNCYLCRSLADCENLNYSYRTVRCRDSYDLMYCYDTEQSYDCSYCFKVFNVRYAFDSRDSFDSAFLYDCRNVRNCFMCWNLRNKDYHIRNQPYSKEEYFEKIKEYNLGSWQVVQILKEEFERLVREEAIHKTNYNVKVTNSSGNYLTQCKNCRECHFLETSEDCSLLFRGLENKDTVDSTGILRGELVCNVCQLTDGYNLLHSVYCINVRYSEYVDFCVDCENCFGCVGLRKKSYCILNKQYNKDEYTRLVAEIKAGMVRAGDYGKFLPYQFAVGGYNLSFAHIMFPKNRAEVEKLGGHWEELEKADLTNIEVSPFLDDIKEVTDDIVQKGLVCEETGRPFNITKDEFSFLRHHSIPLPHHYPDVRTVSRIQRLFNFKPYGSTCTFCAKPIVSYYPPEWGYKKIACVECYQKQVI